MNTAAQIGHALTSEAEAVRIFTLQRAAHREHPIPSLEIRRKNLKRLEMMLLENQDAICAAISQDFGNRAHQIHRHHPGHRPKEHLWRGG